MKKNGTTGVNASMNSKSLNQGEPVRMRTGHEGPRITSKERGKIEAEISQQFPDSNQLLKEVMNQYGAKTGQEVRDIIIYEMLREVLLSLDIAFNANKLSILDNSLISKIRDLKFKASFNNLCR